VFSVILEVAPPQHIRKTGYKVYIQLQQLIIVSVH